MGRVKVVNSSNDSNIKSNVLSELSADALFTFGSFTVTSNFDGKVPIDYTKQLSSFVTPVTLETIGIDEAESDIIYDNTINVIPNLDKSDLKTFVRFGSGYEFLRVSVENVLVNYPGSLFINSQTLRGGNVTYYDFTYNPLTNKAIFTIPMDYVVNTFGLIVDMGNQTQPDDIELKNLNISYSKYVVWSSTFSGEAYPVIGFSGFTSGNKNLRIETVGNPFPSITGTSGSFNIHIKPNNLIFEEYRSTLNDYEKYIVSFRDEERGFSFKLKDPTLLDDGTITYNNTIIIWPTSDGYNIDVNTQGYSVFLQVVLTIGEKYDKIKTDLISRFLTPSSLKTYDLTEEGKMNKLLRIYGREFDQMREFIDSLVYVNKITYDKINNVPDQLIKNLSNTFGWDYFSLVNEEELINSFFSIDEKERNMNDDLLPSEIDIELWRRILLNTNYFWKTKGTREAIKSIFLLIGIPEPFINITEYVYTVDNKIDPRTVDLLPSEYPSNSLPYDTSGYPIAPLESSDFFFQYSGNTDSGQAYMDVFRMAGFTLSRTEDNKKSWIQTGATTRVDDTTSKYQQLDSKLVLNTKEVDVALDTARGIEYDVYDYIKNTDFPANSSGYTLPYSYVNVSLSYSGSENTFTLPARYDKAEGDLEVRFNGILLNAPKEYSGGTIYDELTEADYTVSGNEFTLTHSAITSGNRRDVVEATYIYSGATQSISGISVQYIVTRISPNLATGTTIPLPSASSGDVQLTINGIALTKGTNQFAADYVIDPNNPEQIVLTNSELISYLAVNPYIQVAYINVSGSTSIAVKSEIYRIDSFSGSKLYFNAAANKYVFRLNYKVNNAEEIKILIDGIALEPNTDYSINTTNQYEIFLPKGLKYGSVISTYYLIGGDDYFEPIVGNDYGLGDISDLSFLQFIELVQRKLINAKNRKVVTNHKGGWYPALLRIYTDYLKRADLDDDNPLKSNGYTFTNLYPFLSKYNSFFQRFVDQLLSATVILRKGGLLIRNSIFTRQKFTYKRGVNFDKTVNYFGDDGSVFLKRPLSKSGEWTDDYVCVDNPCFGFVVSDIIIEYPTTTTTTTAYPYGSVVTLDTTLTQQTISTPSNSGKYRKSDVLFTFTPEIIPNYEVTLKLDYTIMQSVTGATSQDLSEAVINIDVNGNVGFITYNNIGTLNGSELISLVIGDVLKVTLENTALIGTGGTLISSETILTPTVVSVTPSGGSFTFTPSSVTNLIKST